MSDSSEEEDMSRFIEAVDTSFIKLIDESRKNPRECIKIEPPRSDRYMEVASHYNDVKVPKELQKSIGDKISAIIDKYFDYVDMEQNFVKEHIVKGGVKLFKDSSGFLSNEEAKDTYTEAHNKVSKRIRLTQKIKLDSDSHITQYSDRDKIKATVVTGEYVLSKEETKYWKSRRKEKLFKYKAVGKNKLIAL